MPRTRPSTRAATTVAGAGVLALAFAAGVSTGPAHAAGHGSTTGNTRVPVAAGTQVTAIPGAKAFGDTDPSTPEQVSFVLKERAKGALEAQVEHGMRHQLSVSQFARQYGQSQRTIDELTSYLASFGIKTTVYADNVDISASGTAGQFDKALAVQQHDYRVPAQRGHGGTGRIPAQMVHGTAQQPTLPRRVADSVLAVLGLSNYSPFVSDAKHINSGIHTTSGAGGSGIDCAALSGLPDACNTPADYVQRYGLAETEAAGNTGAGRTIGIVTLAALDQGAPEYFWSQVLHLPDTGRTVSVQNIDGGPGAPSDAAGTGETDLDVEQSGGVAPGANVTVYQAPNTDNGFADAFFTAASQNTADSVSASWGESETIIAASVASGVETPQYQAAFDEAFLEMAAQGQSVFASAGDEGAYDASRDLGTTNLSVDAPADSPYITSAGGTTLPWSATLTSSSTGKSANVSVTDERAWGWDYLWAPLATLHNTTEADTAVREIGGGGGGYSQLESRPSYQRRLVGSFSAVPYLTPTDVQTVSGIQEPTSWSFDGNPAVTTGQASGRVEPDVSADADPYTGYLLYEPSAVGSKELQGGWGGTSFVAPQLNGSAAVMDQALGHRVGFLNPALYDLAAGKDSPLNTLDTSGTSNDNLYYTGTAGTRYNPATGLGTPDFGGILSQLRHR